MLEDEHHALVMRGQEADRSRFKTTFTSSNPEICERDGLEGLTGEGDDESIVGGSKGQE